MKTIIKLAIAFLVVLFLILLVVNYIKSQPDLISFFDEAYSSAEGIEDVLKNTFAGMEEVIKYIGGEIGADVG